jgi:hypothetical protein
MSITKVITLNNRGGHNKTYVKQFNDETHFQNWYKKTSRSGSKIIGVNG